MDRKESYRGFLIALEEHTSRHRWIAIISSDDPALTELIADGGIVTIDGTDRQDARMQARQFIDTLIEPHLKGANRFQVGQNWGGDGVEGEVVETRLDGLEARVRIEGKISPWIVLDPRNGRWSLKRQS